MGTPIPWPVEGVPCPLCWGVGKPFFSFASPKYVQATVTGMLRGPNWFPGQFEPPNGFYELEEDGPCIWRFVQPILSGSWVLTPGQSSFNIDMPIRLNAFLGFGLACERNIENTNPDWPLIWYDGEVSITWLGGP